MTPADLPPAPAVQAGLLAQLAPGPRQLRAELEDLVARKLLGPRAGPDEEVTESRLQDRYLVGMLAPKNKFIRAAEMDPLAEDGEGSVEDGATDDSALPADSFFPSSVGLTCSVQADAQELLVTTRWGRYLREKSASATTPQDTPSTVWKRHPMGNVGKTIALAEGDIAPIAVDPNQPEVFLQSQVRKLEGFDAAGKPRTRNPKQPVTLRHLLTHTAGFSYEIWSGDIQKNLEGGRSACWSRNAPPTRQMRHRAGQRFTSLTRKICAHRDIS